MTCDNCYQFNVNYPPAGWVFVVGDLKIQGLHGRIRSIGQGDQSAGSLQLPEPPPPLLLILISTSSFNWVSSLSSSSSFHTTTFFIPLSPQVVTLLKLLHPPSVTLPAGDPCHIQTSAHIQRLHLQRSLNTLFPNFYSHARNELEIALPLGSSEYFCRFYWTFPSCCNQETTTTHRF